MALKKTARNSASHNGISSDLAVDGDENRCSHTTTTSGGRAWWYVDLGYNHVINKVKLTSNINGNGELQNYKMRVTIILLQMSPTTTQSEI